VVELSDADVHEDAVVVVLVDAGLAFGAVPHPHPLAQVALQTPLIESAHDGNPTVVLIAARVVLEHQVVQH